MSTPMLDISKVHSLGSFNTNSEDSSLGTITHSPSSLDMYEVYSLLYDMYENPCKWHKTILAPPDLIYKMVPTYKGHKMCLALPR